MNFRKLSAVLGAALLGTMVAASSFAAESHIDQIKDRGYIKVGVKNDVLGFSFRDPLSGEFKGYEDTLAEMIAEDLGVDVEFTAVTAATRGELIDSGDLDLVLATFTITPERLKVWKFSTPYYTDYVSVLVENSSNIKTLKDLIGKKVGVSSGSTSAQALVSAMVAEGLIPAEKFNPQAFDPATWTEGVTFQQYDNYPTISTALSAGEVQAFCMDKSTLAIYRTGSRSLVDAQFAPQEYGAVTRLDSDLGTHVDKLIQGWKDDGTLQKLMEENHIN